MQSNDTIAALLRLESVIIITFFIAPLAVPPNLMTRNDAFLTRNWRDDVQLISNDAVAMGGRRLQGIIHDRILINETAALRHGAAINEGCIAQGKFKIIPSVAIFGIGGGHKQRISCAFGINVVGFHFPNVGIATDSVVGIRGIIVKTEFQIHNAIAAKLIAQGNGGKLCLVGMVEGHSVPHILLMAPSNRIRHMVAVIDFNRLVNGVSTGFINHIFNRLALRYDFARFRNRIGIAGRDGGKPLVFSRYDGNHHGADEILTAGIPRHKLNPIAVVGGLHHHR